MNALPFGLTQLQLALLIFGVVVVLLVVVFSKRDKGNVKTDARGSRVIAQPRVEEPSTYGITGEFDEFGVGKPRRHGDARPAGKMPQLNIEPGPVRAAPPPERKPPAYMTQPKPTVAPVTRRIAPSVQPQVAAPPAPQPAPPTPPPVSAPAPTPVPPPAAAPPAAKPAQVPPTLTLAQSPGAASTPAAQRKIEEKIVTLLVARNNGVAMTGPRIHAAMSGCGLSFGPMQIYHRKHDGKRVFSVASLLKPGFLIPEDAEGFSTMALSVFMVLPGPMEAQAAFEDMLHTVKALADQLEAQVYDDRRQPLNEQTIQKLRGDIKAWASRAGGA